ncbi:MAG: hypothetical protein ABSF64_09380 [Bryobacteraceae bacterium]|jgi:hypothetical protein
MSIEGTDLGRVDLKLQSLMSQRRYYRDVKIPAQKQALEAVKDMIGSGCNMHPSQLPPDAGMEWLREEYTKWLGHDYFEWLAHEYIDISKAVEKLQLEIDLIERQAERLSGRSIEDLQGKRW